MKTRLFASIRIFQHLLLSVSRASIFQKATSFTWRTVLSLSLFLGGWQAPSPKPPLPPGAGTPGPVSPSTGAFSSEIPIKVPAFHGLEPDLSLIYSSGAGDGFLGMGWGLSGQSFVERASPGQGVPEYSASDIFLLDG